MKAVMVYIKVVLKPPSASHNSEAIQGSPRRNMYIKKSKKGIKKRDKNIQSEARYKIESGIKITKNPGFISQERLSPFLPCQFLCEDSYMLTIPLGNGFT